MSGRDLLRLPGVNPGQHCNGLQPVPHTFWLLAEGMHKEQGKGGASEPIHYLLVTPLMPCQINLCVPWAMFPLHLQFFRPVLASVSSSVLKA